MCYRDEHVEAIIFTDSTRRCCIDPDMLPDADPDAVPPLVLVPPVAVPVVPPAAVPAPPAALPVVPLPLPDPELPDCSRPVTCTCWLT